MLNELSYHSNLILVVLRCYYVWYALTRAVMPSLYILSFSLSLISTASAWSRQNTLFRHVIKRVLPFCTMGSSELVTIVQSFTKVFSSNVRSEHCAFYVPWKHTNSNREVRLNCWRRVLKSSTEFPPVPPCQQIKMDICLQISVFPWKWTQ
jgi:hypothetical protein